MTCERCEGLMRGEPLMIVGELFPPRLLATYHCMNCGRIDYCTTPARAALTDNVGLAA
jgi:hypothetical protein